MVGSVAKFLTVAAGVLAMVPAARAQAVSGPYISLGAGGNLLPQLHSNGAPAFGFPGYNLKFSPGLVGLGALGYKFDDGLRLEVEGDYRSNTVRGISAPYAIAQGTERKYGAMFNALYDFKIGGPIAPYIGLGLGDESAQRYDFAAAGPGAPLPAAGSYRASDFAYQAIVGASYPLPFAGVSLTAEYRFLGLVDSSGGYPTNIYEGNQQVGTTSLHYNNDYNHSVLLGLRFAFAAPAPSLPPEATTPVPPEEAAPVQSAVRTYLVFFDWDRSDLTERARQIVAEAAAASTHVEVTRIDLNGYTDSSGSKAYNVHLSWSRAQSVQDELVRDGVPEEEIVIHGLGDSNPLVKSKPGAREPQNRRVEIIFS